MEQLSEQSIHEILLEASNRINSSIAIKEAASKRLNDLFIPLQNDMRKFNLEYSLLNDFLEQKNIIEDNLSNKDIDKIYKDVLVSVKSHRDFLRINFENSLGTKEEKKKYNIDVEYEIYEAAVEYVFSFL